MFTKLPNLEIREYHSLTADSVKFIFMKREQNLFASTKNHSKHKGLHKIMKIHGYANNYYGGM